MGFEDDFAELDRMLLARSSDYTRMREKLEAIAQAGEFVRALGPAQDNLYASIARSHRKALEHLEAGNQVEAMREMAGAVSWFLKRFEGTGTEALGKVLPKIGEELRLCSALAVQSEVLKEAVAHEGDLRFTKNLER